MQSVQKSPKILHLNFLISEFSTNFCPLKSQWWMKFFLWFSNTVPVCIRRQIGKKLLAPYPFLNTSFATKKLSFHIIIYLDPIFQATNDFREFAKQKMPCFLNCVISLKKEVINESILVWTVKSWCRKMIRAEKRSAAPDENIIKMMQQPSH